MTTTALLPAPAPCTEPACLHATPGLPCRCTDCHGAGHGHQTNTDRAAQAEASQGEILRRLTVMGGIVTSEEEPW